MNYKTKTTVQNWVIVIGCLVLLGLLTALNSCTSCSESGRRSVATQSVKAEKVVILDGLETVNLTDVSATTYKVKRIEHSVVTWIRVVNTPRYEAGDTIYWLFK